MFIRITPIRELPRPYLQTLVLLGINMIRANGYEDEPKSVVASSVDILNRNFQAIKMVINKVTIIQENNC
jgi:hypothetical protein